MKVGKKSFIGLASFICVVLLLSPAWATAVNLGQHNKESEASQGTSQSNYWALLFAVGVYLNAPDQNRPSMLEACDNLTACLLDSPQYWNEENIRVVKGSDATLQNLIKGLLWLRKNSQSEDHVVVYITTHGNHLYSPFNGQPWDLPPKDEADGSDEVLIMYNGFDKWYGFITDDLLNFFLSMIRCQGLCLIVDSCYSGGFNDPPMFGTTRQNRQVSYTAESYSEGFVQSVAGQGRVVLMSSQENQVSFGSFFSEFLISGFEGRADSNGNNDGINSAEEAFSYAKPWVELIVFFWTGHQQTPTISDLYPGEFPVTMS